MMYATTRVAQLALPPRTGVSDHAGGKHALSREALSLPPSTRDTRVARDLMSSEEALLSSAIFSFRLELRSSQIVENRLVMQIPQR